MDFTLDISLSDKGYVLIVAHGPYDDSSSRIVVKSIEECFQQHGVKSFLIDQRDVDMQLDVLAVFDRVKLYQKAEVLGRSFKIAQVASDKDMETFSFYEDVVANRGYNIRIFYSRVEAESWLLNGTLS